MLFPQRYAIVIKWMDSCVSLWHYCPIRSPWRHELAREPECVLSGAPGSVWVIPPWQPRAGSRASPSQPSALQPLVSIPQLLLAVCSFEIANTGSHWSSCFQQDSLLAISNNYERRRMQIECVACGVMKCHELCQISADGECSKPSVHSNCSGSRVMVECGLWSVGPVLWCW